MKKKNMKMIPPALLLALLCGCGSEEVPTPAGGSPGTETQEEKPVATFTSDPSATRTAASGLTRTTISHTLGARAQALWEAGDRIWVKADDGTLHQSAAGVFNTALTRGMFSLSAGAFSSGCQVNYTGRNATAGDRVTIAAAQSQSRPNDFSHAGASGDCGTATATGNGTDFTFRLAHKAAYLCFLPRARNTAFAACVLTGIKLTSDKPIAGVYDFASGSLGSTPVSGSSNTITLTTNDFAIPSTTSASTNASYAVVAPGTHQLTIQYQLKDPVTAQTGTVTKYVTMTLAEGKMYEVTANFDTNVYPREYYLWDARYHVWHGYTADQPYANNTYDTNGANNYPVSPTDIRWYNPTTSMSSVAQYSAKNCPTTNEITWYVSYGDPYWDANELWAWDGMGRVQKGGMWIKKKAKIPGYTATIGSTGINYNRITPMQSGISTPTKAGRPSASSLGDYFYLPAAGRYRRLLNGYTGLMVNVGITGTYFPSTNTPIGADPDPTYSLHFDKDYLYLGTGGTKKDAVRIWTAQ